MQAARRASACRPQRGRSLLEGKEKDGGGDEEEPNRRGIRQYLFHEIQRVLKQTGNEDDKLSEHISLCVGHQCSRSFLVTEIFFYFSLVELLRSELRLDQQEPAPEEASVI
jgi:hypothetical protein